MNTALDPGGLFAWLRRMINDPWSMFARERTALQNPVATSSAEFILPLRPTERANVRLAVLPIELQRAP